MFGNIGAAIARFVAAFVWNGRIFIYPVLALFLIGFVLYLIARNYQPEDEASLAVLVMAITAVALGANMLAATAASLVPWRTQIHWKGLLRCYAKKTPNGRIVLRMEAHGRITEKVQQIGYFISGDDKPYWFHPGRNSFPIVLEYLDWSTTKWKIPREHRCCKIEEVLVVTGRRNEIFVAIGDGKVNLGRSIRRRIARMAGRADYWPERVLPKNGRLPRSRKRGTGHH